MPLPPGSCGTLRVLQLRDLPHPIPRAWFSFLAFSLTNPINPLHPCESFPLPHLQSLTTFALILTPSSPPLPLPSSHLHCSRHARPDLLLGSASGKHRAEHESTAQADDDHLEG